MLCLKVEQKSEVMKKKGNRTGQALMEFVLGLMIVISFFFFFMKMSATFVVGNFIHYATFMSARAYIPMCAHVCVRVCMYVCSAGVCVCV